jgi:hypothetical protein
MPPRQGSLPPDDQLRLQRRGHDMKPGEGDLPPVLQWQPGIIADPVPEWWLRGIDVELQKELVAIRLETTQKVLQVQAEGLAAATRVLRQ